MLRSRVCLRRSVCRSSARHPARMADGDQRTAFIRRAVAETRNEQRIQWLGGSDTNLYLRVKMSRQARLRAAGRSLGFAYALRDSSAGVADVAALRLSAATS